MSVTKILAIHKYINTNAANQIRPKVWANPEKNAVVTDKWTNGQIGPFWTFWPDFGQAKIFPEKIGSVSYLWSLNVMQNIKKTTDKWTNLAILGNFWHFFGKARIYKKVRFRQFWVLMVRQLHAKYKKK